MDMTLIKDETEAHKIEPKSKINILLRLGPKFASPLGIGHKLFSDILLPIIHFVATLAV